MCATCIPSCVPCQLPDPARARQASCTQGITSKDFSSRTRPTWYVSYAGSTVAICSNGTNPARRIGTTCGAIDIAVCRRRRHSDLPLPEALGDTVRRYHCTAVRSRAHLHRLHHVNNDAVCGAAGTLELHLHCRQPVPRGLQKPK